MKKILLILSALFCSSCNSQTKFDLDKVLQMDREDLIVMEIDTYLNTKSEYGEKIEKLNSSQQTFLFIENLEREINNGGFNQFYFNSSGNFSKQTVNALLEIGAKKTAEIVKKANSEFQNGVVPENWEKRQGIVIKISEKADVVWEKCDEAFLEYTENLTDLLLAYVHRNKEHFVK